MKIKKIFSLLVLFCCVVPIISAETHINFEDIFQAKNILKVSKKIVDVPLNDISLAYLSNEDCRLLRNSIFYYHGYSFKSDELREYFYNFYTKTTSNETPLSDIDNKNVELIKLYETREFSTEKELKTQKLPEDFIGSWYLEGFTIGNDDPANLKINKNSTFNFYFLNNGGSSYYRGFGGNVYVYRNTMFLYINEILISEEKI